MIDGVFEAEARIHHRQGWKTTACVRRPCFLQRYQILVDEERGAGGGRNRSRSESRVEGSQTRVEEVAVRLTDAC